MAQLDTVIESVNDPIFGYEAFEQIVLNAPVAISITDQEGKILFVNQTFCDITEYALEDLIGKNSSLLSYRATPRSVYETLWANISAGKHWQGQLVNRKKSGVPYIADISISRFTNKHGEYCYYAIQKDITVQHEIQTHQKNQYTMFQAVLNAAPIAIALANNENTILFSNERFTKLGESIDEAPLKLLLDNIQEEYGYSSLSEFMGNKHQKYKGIHIENHGPIRERWFDFVLVKIPVSDTTAETYFNHKDEYYTVVAINERTREKLLVEERRINSVKLLAGDNKYVHAMQEALMATLHQLQGPFNMIDSAVNILKQRNSGCPGLLAMDEAMNTAVSAMYEIKQAIPERSGEAFQPVNINQIIRDVTAISTDELLLSSTDLDLNLEHRLSTINGMPHRLILAIKQLLDNAIDSIQSSKKSDRVIRISSFENDTEINVCVEDSGCGVPQDIRIKIFQPFFSTKPRYQTGFRGIGLSIVQQVLNEHSATISIEDSEQLGGARIRITFPNNAVLSNTFPGENW